MPRPKRQPPQTSPKEARWKRAPEQLNPKYCDGFFDHGPHDEHYIEPDNRAGEKPMLCCSLHPSAYAMLLDLYQYHIGEYTALKLELASLRCLVTEILTEIRLKPTPTLTPQLPVVRQEPKAATAPPCQQKTDSKRKRTV
jgi:hypothetical protein